MKELWTQPLNDVIGDEAFAATYGRLPNRQDTEQERIRAHLTFVAERWLREGWDRAALAPEALEKRRAAASELEAYAAVGDFPLHRILAPESRTPIFVDHRGTACAVGHLMRVTGAAKLCEDVDRAHHFGLVNDILAHGDASLVARVLQWAQDVGLTTSDLAVIQPGYTARDHCSLVLAIGIASFGSAFALLGGVFGAVLWGLRGGDSWRSEEVALVAIAVVLAAVAGLATAVNFLVPGRSREVIWTVLACLYGLLVLAAVPVDFALLSVLAWGPEGWKGADSSRKAVLITAWVVLVGVFLSCSVYLTLGGIVSLRMPRHYRRRKPQPEDTEASSADSSSSGDS